MSGTGSFGNLRLKPSDDPPGASSDISVELANDEPNPVKIDPKTKIAEIPTSDGSGSVRVFLDGLPSSANDNSEDRFYHNIAGEISSDVLGQIASDLMIGIQNDEDSRRDWMDSRAEGMKLLGLKLEDGKLGSGADNTGVEGMSRFRDPSLLEAVIRGHANARAELLPTDGPVKVRDDDIHPTLQDDDDANALENDMNHYLTVVDKSYYPDTSRALWWTFFGGCAFKKVHHDPIKRRPVSETVDATNIIVSNGAVDIASAPRVTHQFKMRRSMMKRMQILGAYRDIDLGTPPPPTSNEVEQAKEEISGVRPSLNTEAKDLEYEMFECYCEYDIPGFEHKTKGRPDGLPLPWKITLEKNSRDIVEVRRNWAKDDDLCLPRIPFVKFTYIDAMGFYGLGLLHCIGSITNAVTALAREMIDAGMLANFPGGLVIKGGARQNQSQFRPGPGEFSPVETNGMAIRDAVMPMPYKEPGPAMFQIHEALSTTAQRIGGTADIQVGEGRQDAPVGTTIALIEQATKPMDAVHKGLHASQAQEFELLVECIREDPQSWIKSLRRPARKWDEVQLLRALDDYDLVPQADPNTSSRMQRIGKAQTIYQMAKDNPGAFNQKAVYDYVGMSIGVGSMDQFLQQGAPPPDPKAQADQANADAKKTSAQADLIEAQTGAKDLAFRQQNQGADYQNQAADRQADLKMEGERLQTEKTISATKIASEHVRHAQNIAAGVAKQRGDLLGKASAQKSDQMHDLRTKGIDQAHDIQSKGADQAHDIRAKVVDAALAPPPVTPKGPSK